jgi:hypothetical protein
MKPLLAERHVFLSNRRAEITFSRKTNMLIRGRIV